MKEKSSCFLEQGTKNVRVSWNKKHGGCSRKHDQEGQVGRIRAPGVVMQRPGGLYSLGTWQERGIRVSWNSRRGKGCSRNHGTRGVEWRTPRLNVKILNGLRYKVSAVEGVFGLVLVLLGTGPAQPPVRCSKKHDEPPPKGGGRAWCHALDRQAQGRPMSTHGARWALKTAST